MRLDDFDGVLSYRVIKFNKPKTTKKKNSSAADESNSGAAVAGPLVDDRKCSRCGHMGMT